MIKAPHTNSLSIARFLFVIALIIALLPYANSGFYSDDIINSTLAGGLHNNNLSLWSLMTKLNKEWIAAGRFFPSTIWLTYSTWCLAPTHFPNRLVQIVLIILNIVICARLLRLLTPSRAFPLVFGAVILSLFQVRQYYDPMTSFSPLLQQVVLLVLLAISFFWKYLESRRLSFFFASLGCHAIVLTSYEISAVVILILVGITYFGGWKREARTFFLLSVHAILAAAFLGLNVYLKLTSVHPYGGVEPKVGPETVTAFFKQLVAAFPLSYLFFDPQHVCRPFPWPDSEGLVLAFALFLAIAGSLTLSLRQVTQIPPNTRLPLLTALLMILVPAALIAISARYQTEMRWGLGHLPVYMEYFGVAIVMATGACWLSAQGRKIGGAFVQSGLSATFATLVGMGAAATFLENRFVVEVQNIGLRYPRDLIEAACQNGLFASVPEGSTILKQSLNPWDTADFYAEHTQRSFQILTYDQWLRSAPDTFYDHLSPTGKVYELSYESDRRKAGSGWALLSRLKDIDFRKSGDRVQIFDRTLTDVIWYRRHGSIAMPPFPAVCEALKFTGGSMETRLRFDLDHLPTLGTGPHWTYGSLPPGNYQHLVVTNAPNSDPGTLIRDVNLFKSVEALSTQVLRVVSAHSQPVDNTLGDNIVAIGFGCDRISADTLLLRGSGGSHLEVSAGDISAGLGLAFCIRPEPQQERHAVIASNHFGGVRGVTIEQDGSSDPNHYVCSIGNGIAWETLGSFSLPSDKWSFVILSVNPTQTKLRVVGPIDYQGELEKAPKRHDVDSGIIYVGNWQPGDRPFHGQMAHITLSPHPFTDAEVAEMISTFHQWRGL